MTITIIGLVALAAGLVVLWRHRWQGSRITVLLMLAGGIGLATGGGLAAHWFNRGGEALGRLADTGTAQLLGVGLPLLLVVAAGVWLAVDLRDRAIHPATPWIALTLPTMVIVLGGVSAGAGLLDSIGV